MMVVMTPQATPAEIEAVVDRLEAAGVHAKVMPGELTTAIGAIGDPEGVRAMGLDGLPGVDQVIPISRPYKLASSELSDHSSTSFEVGGRTVGGNKTFCLIAGPCTVESADQTAEVARAVAASGASMLRGGAFKPRTSPFSFKGLGPKSLEILAAAGKETGLPVVSELTDTAHADRFAELVDVVQVGARNMQNYGLLEVVGRLMAADYVLKEGEERVILCERGIRTFETATRFTLDVGAVPWLKLHSHLPVIVDRCWRRRDDRGGGTGSRRGAMRRPSAVARGGLLGFRGGSGRPR